MLLEFLGFAKKLRLAKIMVSLDDSTGKKDKATRHLEAVCFHHNHNDGSKSKPKYVNGFVYVEVHIQMGWIGFTWDTRVYLRECIVRKLNRHRQPENRLHYRSKYALAHAMLTELAMMLPKGSQVVVLFDSWYSSAKLIKFCRRQGWQVVCAIISRRHKGDHSPKFFVYTDLSLSAQEALRLYQRRWPVEVDNFYLKEGLGLADFRLQSFDAIDKWFAVSLVSINYLQFQQAQSYVETGKLPRLADLIRQHRWTHVETVIRRIAEEALQTGKVEEVLQRYLPSAA
jgi:hypothetical protein